MNREQIDDVICEIMSQDGPDRHVDGHEVITDFIEHLQSDLGELWIEKYKKEKKKTTFI